MLRFDCHSCGRKLKIREQYAGQKARCPRCRGVLDVPEIPGAAVEPAAPEITAEAGQSQSLQNVPPSRQASQIHAQSKTSWLTRFFVPTYDELSLFVMSVAFIVLFAAEPTMRKELGRLLARIEGASGYIIFPAIFLLGMGLSLYHVFTTRKKILAEKYLMLMFAVLVNAAAGIFAGLHLLKHTSGWLAVFPVWNIINGILLLLMFRYRVLDAHSISDRDATPVQMMFGFVAVMIIFLVCKLAFRLYWALTFSICVAYAATLDKAIQSFFPRSLVPYDGD